MGQGPLSRIRVTVTISAEIEPGMYIELHSFEKYLPKLRLSEREFKELTRDSAIVRQVLHDNGVLP